jgi:hypothetical protein
MTVTLEVETMRDGPEEVEIHSRAEVIEVGQDRNGNLLTSLVMVPSEMAASRRAPGRPDVSLDTFRRALMYALEQGGESFQPEPGRLPVRAVDQEKVRAKFDTLYNDAEKDKQKSPEARAKAFRRGVQRAATDKLIESLNAPDGRTMLWWRVST